ncbi:MULTISPECIES: PQQ-dependent catabolism-associated CXXCW motif protein [Rhodomicrobium]|uniref:PQQ-dependent catabolism-associated CXXCW motif protein n=1 Tax=Rhodomicrobium TaxID=1068 RepID=UPI000B4B0BEA|nr:MULTISPECIES: PQQ-dependent catabolism-associated CXXCW motif protein [Rhodomicrobium]
MGRQAKAWALGWLALTLALGGARFEARAAEVAAPAEPSAYRLDDYRSPTPATLKGATVVTSGEAMALWRTKAASFIDVMPRPHRPANLPPQSVWHVPDHDSIPGSLWLPNTGYGVLSPAMAAHFEHSLAGLTKGDRAAPLLFYCLRNCWMSWNAAKRALELGYRRVFWFPEGIEGWSEIGGALEPATPVEPAP